MGRSKARFLHMFGFNETNINLLEQGLLTIAQTEKVKEVISSPHGTKYTIDGVLQTPTSRTVNIRTVWIIEKGRDNPRFVAAFPI